MLPTATATLAKPKANPTPRQPTTARVLHVLSLPTIFSFKSPDASFSHTWKTSRTKLPTLPKIKSTKLFANTGLPNSSSAYTAKPTDALVFTNSMPGLPHSGDTFVCMDTAWNSCINKRTWKSKNISNAWPSGKNSKKLKRKTTTKKNPPSSRMQRRGVLPSRHPPPAVSGNHNPKTP